MVKEFQCKLLKNLVTLYTLLWALKWIYNLSFSDPQPFSCVNPPTNSPKTKMSSSQSPWRNSTIKAPTTGRYFSETSSNIRGRPSSMFYSRTSPPRSTVPPGPLPPDRDLMEGLSKTPLLEDNISVPKHDEEQEDVCIKGYTYIGSYNWIKGDTPIILVPG